MATIERQAREAEGEEESSVPKRRRDKTRKWWQSANTKFGMRTMQLAALVTAIFIFLSESKTAMAAFDAVMKFMAEQVHQPESWSANITSAVLEALKADTSYQRNGPSQSEP